MAKKLFETNDRDEAHAKLEALLTEYPDAECRVDPESTTGIHQVWSGPAPRPAASPATTEEPRGITPAVVKMELTDEHLDKIAGAVAARLAAKAAPKKRRK
jgi:hypothetical protein